ncbi:MAG: PBSX family phage terminase large subunit [Bacteroidales bacterium]|nr:PBSX family phage terminase large subunit [Bacteroidales bacterium]
MREIVVNIEEDFNKDFLPVINDKNRILLIYGGAGAGKSYAVAQKIIAICCKYKDKKILCIRKTFPSLRLTTVETIMQLLHKYHIPFKLNKAEYILYLNGNRVIFKGLDDPEKIKSVTDVDYIWIEEATELTKEEFMQCNLRLRGQELPKGHYRQLIATFNPIGENNWIYKNYFNRDIDDVKRYKYNYRSNNFLDSEYINELERLKEQDEELYRVFTLGEWGQLIGLIFPSWKTAKKIPEGVTYYGLDFGYENPTALIEVTQREDELYVKELIYKTHMTNSELIEEMKSLNIKGTIIADSAEPNRIEEIYKAGFDIRPANKGRDSVRLGIDFLKRFKVYMVDSPNIEKERSSYAFKKDKKGEPLDEPVEYNNHAIDAIRYATSFNLTRRKLRVSVI